MDKDLQNALAFYQPAPEGWFSGLGQKMEAAGEWIWETIQGDFNENQTTGQVVTGTLISMIPLVDQICDVRDLVANCKKIKEDENSTGPWVALVLTLIGLFPSLGSLVKGCMKVLLLSGRKTFMRASQSGSLVAKSIDEGMALLHKLLDMPAVRHTLKSRKIYNIYHFLEKQVRSLKASLTAKSLLKNFDELLSATRSLLDKAVSWGPASLRRPAAALWELLTDVRRKADVMIARALKPVSDYLERLANRLRVEGDNLYRAKAGKNLHVLGSERAAKELEAFKKKKPEWVDKGLKKPQYPALDDLKPIHYEKIDAGWPDIRYEKDRALPTNGAFNTFDDSIKAVELPPGEKLYRVVDPSSGDNSICWMREAEFTALKSKSDWRRRFAVWKSWNENGEYVVYTVPPGKPLKVWEGRAATQINKKVPEYSLEGGAVQIVLDPADLKKEFTGPRRQTGWGYRDFDDDPAYPYQGLPQLENKHKWHGK
ncbi:hypothetical protein [Intestinirhabdus alba]|jgi:hypothetical protein|uniref:Uncharacterized protein n=1 Tax=Intestinirhabdus alba TaxID=2899544 RepID=A0A6L6IR12_9ENTR|nr:hypothetical protein [Intestinirhabdus alba]MTH48949.1 hypothetical protein [Intestinirhabdus alba]